MEGSLPSRQTWSRLSPPLLSASEQQDLSSASTYSDGEITTISILFLFFFKERFLMLISSFQGHKTLSQLFFMSSSLAMQEV